MAEFRKILSPEEIQSGTIRWDRTQEQEIRQVLPSTLVFDLQLDGSRLDHLTANWEKRELFIGDEVQKLLPGSEIALFPGQTGGTEVMGKILSPSERIVIRKRLSQNEFKQRQLKWYAREDDLYRRLFPHERTFIIEIGGKKVPGHPPNFDRRTVKVGESLRCFAPGDHLLIRWALDTEIPTLVINKEVMPASVAIDAMTSLRSLVTRLISRPLQEFNEGEVKGLIVLLDENKKLWERLMALKDENQHLKEQIATLESVFEQFTKNSFFRCKRDFEEWCAAHIDMFERGIRVLHQRYAVKTAAQKIRRLDLLCQDRKGVLTAVEIAFNPRPGDLDDTLELLTFLKQNIQSLGIELTGGLLEAREIRGMIVTNRESADLVEQCIQRGLKLCVVNSGCVIDVLE